MTDEELDALIAASEMWWRERLKLSRDRRARQLDCV